MADNDDNNTLIEDAEISRREMMRLTGASIAVALTGLNSEANEKSSVAQRRARAPLFFTREEFALVDELTELIIPADEHSPGARAARAADYIDRRLAESVEEETKQLWRGGLKLIDTLSEQMHGRPFMQASAEQRVAVLARISQNEASPQKPEEMFFTELKARTAYAYYTSKIGIHQELEYKGNTYLKEFAGYDAT